MLWRKAQRCDPRARALSDRHYSRQTPGSPHFTPPARTVVLLTPNADAVWVSSWPYPEYTHRLWHPEAFVCTIFRNEGSILSSELIRQAVSATRAIWGDNPAGMVTMVDEKKVRSRNPGCCFKKAGFVVCGRTQERNLVVLHLSAELMPAPVLPWGVQLPLDIERVA